MLVLTRKHRQTLMIGDQIQLTVVRIDGNRVQLGIKAPREISIIREELIAPAISLAPGTTDELSHYLRGPASAAE